MDLETATDKIKQKLAYAAGLSAAVKFDFGDDGVVFVNTKESPAEVSNDADADADVTLSCKLATFEGFLDGTQDPNIAFMMGKLKVKGNMGLALKLSSILED